MVVVDTSTFMGEDSWFRLMHNLCPYHRGNSIHKPIVLVMSSQGQKLVVINCLHYSVYFVVLCFCGGYFFGPQ